MEDNTDTQTDYKRGDAGPDGRIFWKKRNDRKSGARWLTPEKFAAYVEKDRLSRAKRQDKRTKSDTKRNSKPAHGDTRKDGYRFWGYHPKCITGEWWVSPEKWAEMKEKALKRRRLTQQPRKAKRVTVPTPKHGDTREDGYRFHGYDKRADREMWFKPEVWERANPNWKPARDAEICRHERYLKQTLRNTRERAAANGWEFDLDFEFLAERFPKDGLCPLSKEPMVWGRESGMGNSPSIDRIDRSKGYTKDNVWWISHRENRKKAEFEDVLPPRLGVYADDHGRAEFDWRIERPGVWRAL